MVKVEINKNHVLANAVRNETTPALQFVNRGQLHSKYPKKRDFLAHSIVEWAVDQSGAKKLNRKQQAIALEKFHDSEAKEKDEKKRLEEEFVERCAGKNNTNISELELQYAEKIYRDFIKAKKYRAG